MKLHDLKPAFGATTAPKRLGRGVGSGLGKTSARATRAPRRVPAAASARRIRGRSDSAHAPAAEARLHQ